MRDAYIRDGKAMMKKARYRFFLIGILLFAAAIAKAGAPSAVQSVDSGEAAEIPAKNAATELPPVYLEQLIEQMLAANPELQSARKRWEAKQKRPGQDRALPDPTIRLGWASAGAPYPGAGLGQDPAANFGVEISQMFPYPGKRALRGTMAHQEARAESSLFQETQQSLVARLKSDYYELQYSFDAIEVLSRNKTLLERLAKLAEIRYAAGQASQQDLIQSQMEISLIETKLLEMERNRQSTTAAINALLNRDPAAELGRPVPGAIPALPSFDALQTSALDFSPMLRAQRAVMDARQMGLELSRRNYYPDFEVMGGYFNQGSMKDMWEFRVQINIPLFFAGKQRLAVEEGVARLSESRKDFQAQEQVLRYRIRDQYLAAENARRLMDLYQKQIIPQASLALESSLNSYSTGSIDFLSVLSNFFAILDNELKYYENRARLLKAAAILSELSGMKMEGTI